MPLFLHRLDSDLERTQMFALNPGSGVLAGR